MTALPTVPGGAVGAVGRDRAGAEALPPWRSVLAVVAHPDDEAIGLGAVLDALVTRGVEVSVLCLTPGESYSASPVTGDLLPLRRSQLAAAARILGVSRVELRDHTESHLADVRPETLAEEVTQAIDTWRPEGLLTFDTTGVNGARDHVAATQAALLAGAQRGLSVLGWGVPAPVARTLNEELGVSHFTPVAPTITIRVDREKQRLATLAYAHDASPGTLVWRRLELLGDVENLRWLRREAGDVTTLRVTHETGDRFAIDVREHRVVVDQPLAVGGDDLGPTPTELFVAGLASCVAFYARRFLHRHRLDATGLTVEAEYRMAARPARVGSVRLRIQVPAGVPEERRAGLLAQASHCTVHTTILRTPQIDIDLA